MDCVSVSSYQWVIWIIWIPITQFSPLSPKQSYTAERKSSLQYKVIVHNSIWKNLFPWKLQQIQRAQERYLIEQILSYKMLFFNIVTTISYAFLLEMNKSHSHKNLCGHLEHGLSSTLLSHCWNALSTNSLYSHPLFGLHKHSASTNECQWMQFFSAWRNSMTHLLFICTYMSDVIPSDCSSAAICHMATKYNGILVGRFNLYCHTTNIYLWCYGPKYWNRRHYFQISPYVMPGALVKKYKNLQDFSIFLCGIAG